MANLMIDIETLGTAPGASIIAVGAVAFGPDGLGPEFSRAIRRQSCIAAGLVEDPATIVWWAGQSPEAVQAAFYHPCAVPLADALAELSGFVRGFADPPLIWGNGANFDPPLLEAAYRAVGQTAPWTFYQVRCYRTLKGLRPDIKMERNGTHHTALDDARDQARHAVVLLKVWIP